MPRRNGTGPMGNGPMTGRGMGYCRGGAGVGYGYGMGRGAGFGRGLGWGMYATPVAPISLAERKRILEDELKQLEAQMKESNE
ncbi:DUF5320 domain-containing protein [Sphaerochaeta sp. S2]|uniref:DUF5320 domain-containing protein n=1 Tax=Sphaerochaeta sp. S2 TaxID=2798868 RepID=UPI0018EA0AA9|nr:DUF5320 domain-containing protein [Sphaerochaeta sp. S2]MBJ2355387.1 DUF5320 domain-containing protein [Sphaerochaeta sp. S2]